MLNTVFIHSLRFFAVLLLFSLSLHTIQAQKYSNEFLSIGVGARAQGLGNAVVAGVDDVTSGVWNPAGLAAMTSEQGLQLGAMHAEWFGGVGKFDYLGISMPLSGRDHRLGLSLVRFGVDQIPNTLSLYEDDGTINYDNVKAFSAADYAFLMSYARQLKSAKGKLSIGGNIKVVHRRIGPFANSWGFGADLGLQYQLNKWSWGVLAKDITTTFNAWSFNFTEEQKETLELTNNEIPISSLEITKPQLILGAGYAFQFNKIGLRPELDIVITTDGKRNTLISSNPFSLDPALGIEANYNKFLFVRLGVNQFQRISDFGGEENLGARPSVGVGLRISSLHLDYAFTNLGDQESRYSHVVSLMLDIKPGKKSSGPENR